ncbi:MAG: cation diffusion facilitator family transporter [Thermodesulfobacteriota bacterium]
MDRAQKPKSPLGAAKLSIFSNFILVSLKLTVGMITGSISVLSEALDSGVDLIASFIAWFSLKEAEKPPDKQHPYGHGKVENISGVIEATLIFTGALFIIYQAVRRLYKGGDIVSINIGIAVMVLSIIVNLFVARYILSQAKSFDSIALEADAWNIKTNAYSSGGVLTGLLIIRFTGLNFLDPVFAIGVALFIIKVSYDVLRKSFTGLVDVKLPEEEENKIAAIINSHNEKYGYLVGFHDLRSRKAGRERHLDLHLVVCKDEKVKEVHDLCDHLEMDINKAFPNSHVVIHVEPCEEGAEDCSIDRCTNKPGYTWKK